MTAAAQPSRRQSRIHRPPTDPRAVAQRQWCITAVFAASLPILLGVQAPPLVVAVAVALVAAAAAGSLLLPRGHRSRVALLAIPFADLVAIGLICGVTGGAGSPFCFLLVLPAISLGIERGRAPIALSGVGSLAAVGLPLVLGSGTVTLDWLRAAVAVVVLTCTTITVSVLTTRLRSRVKSVQRLRHELERLLALSHDHAAAAVATSAMLRESTLLLSSVVDAVTEQFIISTDASGRIDVFNPGAERLLGVAAHDVLRRDLVATFGQLLIEEVRGGPPAGRLVALADIGFEAMVGAARVGRPEMELWRFQQSAEAILTIQLAITARHDADGVINGFLFVGTDVSEVREEMRLKDEFVSLISHELRTPLSSILGYLELIHDDEDNPLSDEQSKYLDIVDRNAHRLLRLVGDLLFTAHVEAGKLSLDEHEVDLREVARVAVESAGPDAGAGRITLALSTSQEPVLVRGDAVRLGQACDNLVSNAVKFTQPGGRVAVTVGVAYSDQDEPERALLSVSDTGVGIPAAEVDRLFARFFRASTATSNAIPGVGLGLSITRAIAIAHHGEVRVASTLGQGTTFTLDLPVQPEPALALPPAPASL